MSSSRHVFRKSFSEQRAQPVDHTSLDSTAWTDVHMKGMVSSGVACVHSGCLEAGSAVGDLFAAAPNNAHVALESTLVTFHYSMRWYRQCQLCSGP